jgi:signal transduction histidine kinase
MKETEKTFSGNGLQNMKNRTEKINGEFKIKSELELGLLFLALFRLLILAIPIQWSVD